MILPWTSLSEVLTGAATGVVSVPVASKVSLVQSRTLCQLREGTFVDASASNLGTTFISEAQQQNHRFISYN